jgi:hypothetical protein
VFTTFEEHHCSIGRAVDGCSAVPRVVNSCGRRCPPTLSFSRPCGPLNTASVRTEYGLLRALAPCGKTTIKAETHGKYRKSLRPLPADNTYLTAPRRDFQGISNRAGRGTGEETPPSTKLNNLAAEDCETVSPSTSSGALVLFIILNIIFENTLSLLFALLYPTDNSVRERNTAELSSFFTSSNSSTRHFCSQPTATAPLLIANTLRAFPLKVRRSPSLQSNDRPIPCGAPAVP